MNCFTFIRIVNGATGGEYRPAPLGEGTAAGKMWTTDTLITDPETIAGLRARGVVSLDMETAAIAALCGQRGIPWSVFRVISDRATDGSIDEEVFHLSNQDGSPNNEAIEKFFADHPERLEAMSRLAEGAHLGKLGASTIDQVDQALVTSRLLDAAVNRHRNQNVFLLDLYLKQTTALTE